MVNSIAVLASLVFILTRTGELGNLTLAGVYFASALPFFFSGAVVSIAVAETIQRVDRVYFFDLLGAAGGCLVLVPFLNYFGGPNTVIAAAVSVRCRRRPSGTIWPERCAAARAPLRLALVFVALHGFQREQPPDRHPLRQGPPNRGGRFVRVEPISRIALAQPKSAIRKIVIDADASTGIPTSICEHLTDAAAARTCCTRAPAFRIRCGRARKRW